MIKYELQLRFRRLLEGRAKGEDIDRLFLDQRESAQGNELFREIGDFLAHRDERSRGPVTQRGRDVFTSFRVWSLGQQGRQPTLDDLREAGAANLNLYTEQEVGAGVGIRKDAARTKFAKALRKIDQGYKLSESDLKVVGFLANKFVWKPAFTGLELCEDFFAVCLRNQVCSLEDRSGLEQSSAILMLHAIARLHGANIKIDDGRVGTLFAGFSNSERQLEVKIDLASGDWAKPTQAPVCLFLTNLDARDHCSEGLIHSGEAPLWQAWVGPIELAEDGKLRMLV